MSDVDLSLLRRRPDVEAPNLVAVDAADRLLLDTADASLRALSPADVVVIGDNFGALTLGALAVGTPSTGAAVLRVHQDPLLAERALAANFAECAKYAFFTSAREDRYVNLPLEPALVAGARLVLLRLPKSLDALDETAALIAARAARDVTVLAGGMVKHMTLAQNEVLVRHFTQVTAGFGRQKARVLTATGPRAATPRSTASATVGGAVGSTGTSGSIAWPRVTRLIDPPIALSTHGGVFAGAALDIGTRFLLEHLDELPDVAMAIDLGCGSGALAVELARRRPGVRVIATDQSAAAVASARETAELNGVAGQVTVVRDDALARHPDASAELILLNPPFHTGTTVAVAVGHRLIADAARVLAPGGELWTVFNSHLRYQPLMRRLIGETRQVDRNPKFTITASRKR